MRAILIRIRFYLILPVIASLLFSCSQVRYYNSPEYEKAKAKRTAEHIQFHAVKFKNPNAEEMSVFTAELNKTSGMLYFDNDSVSVAGLEYLKYSNSHRGLQTGIIGLLMGTLFVYGVFPSAEQLESDELANGYRLFGMLFISFPMFLVGQLAGSKYVSDWQEFDLTAYRSPVEDIK